MIAALLVLGIGGAVQQARALNYGQPSAALWKDQLFVAINGKHFVSASWLYRGTFAPALKRVRSPVEHYNPGGYGPCSTQAKLDIRSDRVLLHNGVAKYLIFPMDVVPALEANEFGAAVRTAAGLDGVFLPYSVSFDCLLFPAHRKHDVPLSGAERDIDDKPSKETYWKNARLDVQVADERSVWLLHVYKDQLFVSVEPDYLSEEYLDKKKELKKELPDAPERRLCTGKMPADFTETFASYSSGGRAYMVAPNGKVYMVAPKGAKEIEVSAVWSDPKRKIVGVVQDQEKGAVYGWGFVTDSAAPERFYVKFDPKPVAVEYKLTVPLWGERSDAYLESYECARAFRKVNEKK